MAVLILPFFFHFFFLPTLPYPLPPHASNSELRTTGSMNQKHSLSPYVFQIKFHSKPSVKIYIQNCDQPNKQEEIAPTCAPILKPKAHSLPNNQYPVPSTKSIPSSSPQKRKNKTPNIQ